MKSILIVEPSEEILIQMLHLVRESKVKVEAIMTCHTWMEAERILMMQEIDLVLFDLPAEIAEQGELQKKENDLQSQCSVLIGFTTDASLPGAVQAIRYGLLDYIALPVPQSGMDELLLKCERELARRAKDQAFLRRIMLERMRDYLLGTGTIASEEKDYFFDYYQRTIGREGYYMCSVCDGAAADGHDYAYLLRDMLDSDVILVPNQSLQRLLEDLSGSNAGVSMLYTELSKCSAAYHEAAEARWRSYCQNKGTVFSEERVPPAVTRLRHEALKYVSEEQCSTRAHMIGTDRTEELTRAYDYQFEIARRGRLTRAEFESAITLSLNIIAKQYGSFLSAEDELLSMEHLDSLQRFMRYNSIDEYRTDFMQLIRKLHETVREAESDNERKIRTAVRFIQDNYRSDLNMAVVSNYVSMNYSLFSALFKKCTGSNFVSYIRDLRMEEAKHLLVTTDDSITGISGKVGYDNAKHFMKSFKQVTGMTPSEFRRNHSFERDPSSTTP